MKDNISNELLDASYFSKLDLMAEYHQVDMVNENIHKIMFETHKGHYEFPIMSG